MRILADAIEGKRNPTGIGMVAKQGLYHMTQLDKKNEYIITPELYNSRTRMKMPLIINFLKHVIWKQVYIPLMAFLRRADVIISFAPEAYFLTRKPVIIMVHDMIFLKLPKPYTGAWGKYWRIIVPISVKKASAVITNSEATKRDVMDLTGISPEKISALHLGINRYENNSETNKFIDLHPYLLFIGNIEPRRGIEDLIKAFNAFRKAYPFYRLVIAGRLNKYGESLSKKADKNIIFLGFIDEKELSSLYRNASAYVYPSHYEGFGLTVLEAMNYGCPVITTNVSSLPEIVGNAAVMVEPGDPNKLRNAMAEVIENAELRNELIRNGYENLKRFSWEKFAKGYIRIIEKMVDLHESSS